MLILWVSGFFVVHTFGSQNSIQNVTEKIENSFKNTIAKVKNAVQSDNEKYNQALHYTNESVCEKIDDENKKQECGDDVRLEKILKNSENADCNILSNDEKKQNCTDLMYEKTALETENKNICKTISQTEIQVRCQEGVDAKIFTKIVKENNISTEKCEKLDGNFKKECLKLIKDYHIEETYFKAIRSEKIENCSEIIEENLKIKCQNEILYLQAKNHNSLHICHGITDADLKKDCITSAENLQNTKIFKTAITSENLAMCSAITDVNIRTRCNDIIILSIVKKTHDSTLCSGVQNAESKKICQKIGNISL